MKAKDSFYRGKRVLIPGGAGFIGSALAKKLIGYGAKVTIVDPFLKCCGANLSNIKDIKNRVVLVRTGIEEFLAKHRISQYNIVFNCVGLTDHHLGQADPYFDYRVNCLTGLKILEKISSERSAVRTISLGSRGQYGRGDVKKFSEDNTTDPVDIHSIHKDILEKYHRVARSRSGLNDIYVRLTNVYGPGQRMHGSGIGALGEMLRSVVTGERITVYGSLERVKDILYIDDCVDALLFLGELRSPYHRVFNLGSGKGTPLKNFIEALGEITKIKVCVKPFPGAIKNIDTGDVVMSIKRIKCATGWAPLVSVKQGVRDTILFYNEHRTEYL